MLDRIAEAWAEEHDGADIWANPNVKFLDPFTKSGIFLREITRRLSEGLIHEIPNLQERVNHILTTQVYGVAITNLTAMLARRSLYCSKWANKEHSICTDFRDEDGNIWFERVEHTWGGGKEEIQIHPLSGEDITVHTNRRCSYCGAHEDSYNRGPEFETHAYAAIHTDNFQQRLTDFFGEPMHFDVVIGNPPYQLSDGGYGASAAPIYQHFVRQCIGLDPELLSLVIPARWYSGGKGLEEFRNEMLTSEKLISLHDFPNTEEVFPGVNVRGGICYFLWGRNHNGDCEVTTHFAPYPDSTVSRPLLEAGVPTFIRFNEGVRILRKVVAKEGGELSTGIYPSFSDLVSSRKPFGLATNYRGLKKRRPSSLTLFTRNGIEFCPTEDVSDRQGLIDEIKIFVPYSSPGSDAYPHLVLSKPIIGKPGEVATETYLAIGPFSSESEARHAAQYMSTKFFRFMVNLLRSSQHVTRGVYSLVPLIPLDRQWTDEDLADRYGLDDSDREFIDRFIKDVAWAGEF
ncbi:Eco57I restriction-modification methylase domain-containing protein [Corynebacterium amycolatum]|uniref:Eco57I restriction-modification methylase domain-containing protein n=1 Tax=Corynebacterium amycolatum TaxID=43765 RepID=UPI000C787ECF|nr:Eco57I restriction-modification methylase domain-containing protein [Corynebacterium amycolatum]PLA34941.1 restriction endonuclease [Corynebacterium amycolatum]